MNVKFTCPKCGGGYFGSSELPDGLSRLHCHDEFGVGCKWFDLRYGGEYFTVDDDTEFCAHGILRKFCIVHIFAPNAKT